MKSLSTGFTGGSTKQVSGFDREVEARLGKLTKMDVFTDEFSPPGTAESFPGADFHKRDAPYDKPHDDKVPEADPQFWKKGELAAAGNARDQQPLDDLDNREYQRDAVIKQIKDQFPGSRLSASDNSQFDVHQTDPARLASSPKEFDKIVEQRMKSLVSGREKSSNPDLYDQRRFFEK